MSDGEGGQSEMASRCAADLRNPCFLGIRFSAIVLDGCTCLFHSANGVGQVAYFQPLGLNQEFSHNSLWIGQIEEGCQCRCRYRRKPKKTPSEEFKIVSRQPECCQKEKKRFSPHRKTTSNCFHTENVSKRCSYVRVDKRLTYMEAKEVVAQLVVSACLFASLIG